MATQGLTDAEVFGSTTARGMTDEEVFGTPPIYTAPTVPLIRPGVDPSVPSPVMPAPGVGPSPPQDNRLPVPVVVGGNAPGYRQSETLPIARREDVINNPNSRWYEGWALAPGPLRALGQTPAENTTINPETGTMNIAPEALAAATALGGVGGLRFGGTNPVYVPLGTFDRRAPLSPEFLQNPLGPSFADREMPRFGPTSETGIPLREPPQPTAGETAPPGGLAQPSSAKPPAADPISKSEDAFKVSDAFYDTFDQAAKDGGSLTPNVANKVVDKVESYLPPPGMAEAFGAGDELKGIVAKLQQYRDKPMSLLDVKAVDQQIGDLIHRERDPIKGMSPYGRQLQEIQDDLRDITEKPAASDVVGGQAGLDALAPARQAYSQAKKMQELERLWEKSQQTENPTTSYRTQVKNLFDNKRRSAGFTDEEEAIVKDAAARGIVGGGVHLLGSRLIPIAASAAELGTHGLTAGTAAFAATYLGGSAMKALENRLATRRFESAQTFLGQRVPQLPNQLGPFAPP